MKCNAVTALVLTASQGDTECYAKNIFMVILGLRGPVDCELCSSRAKKKNLNIVSSCQLLCNQIVVYFLSQCTESFKDCFKSQARGRSQTFDLKPFEAKDLEFCFRRRFSVQCVPSSFIRLSFYTKKPY